MDVVAGGVSGFLCFAYTGRICHNVVVVRAAQNKCITYKTRLRQSGTDRQTD